MPLALGAEVDRLGEIAGQLAVATLAAQISSVEALAPEEPEVRFLGGPVPPEVQQNAQNKARERREKGLSAGGWAFPTGAALKFPPKEEPAPTSDHTKTEGEE